MTDREEALLRDFDKAGAAIRKSLTTTGGGTGAETNYSQAYQALVREGLAPQIRRKYR